MDNGCPVDDIHFTPGEDDGIIHHQAPTTETSREKSEKTLRLIILLRMAITRFELVNKNVDIKYKKIVIFNKSK